MLDFFYVTTFHVFADLVEAIHGGKVDVIPIRLSELPSLFSSGRLQIDVALVQVSPPDNAGFCNLGVSVGFTRDAALSAKMLIAEVNEQMPRTYGNTKIPIDRCNYVVETSRPLLENLRHERVGDDEMAVAKNVCQLINNGSTLCVGVGNIGEAVMNSLQGKRDLGVHAGLITDSIIGPIEEGIITNGQKTINRGRTVASFVSGSKKIFQFVNENPYVEIHPYSYVHSAETISQLDNFVSVSSAINTDLSGQINSEFVQGKQIGIVAGQADFVRGAGLSRGGKTIFAFASTAKKGEVSRIVVKLAEGTPVTIPRYDTHYVVTEYGIAELWGKSLSQRADALTAIAHPRFRDQLFHASKRL
jgi:4-hydroxybutyrate CoA-transferase